MRQIYYYRLGSAAARMGTFPVRGGLKSRAAVALPPLFTHIGQINFYLEALDRDVKKPNENPSVGVILCAGKDDAVVEYALSRSMSPTLVSDYTLHLPDKKLLQNKLRELTELALESGEGDEE